MAALQCTARAGRGVTHALHGCQCCAHRLEWRHGCGPGAATSHPAPRSGIGPETAAVIIGLTAAGNVRAASRTTSSMDKGLHCIAISDKHGNPQRATLEIRYRKMRVLPPVGKQKQCPAHILTIIHTEGHGAPVSREKTAWKLIIDLPVRSRQDAVEKIKWCGLRWKIGVSHKSRAAEQNLRMRPSRRRCCSDLLLRRPWPQGRDGGFDLTSSTICRTALTTSSG